MGLACFGVKNSILPLGLRFTKEKTIVNGKFKFEHDSRNKKGIRSKSVSEKWD